MITPDCNTATATPETIPLPGSTTLSVRVDKDNGNAIRVRLVIPDEVDVVFDDGSKEIPFDHQAPAGRTTIRRRVGFRPTGAALALFTVLIEMAERQMDGSLSEEYECSFAIGVQLAGA